MATLIGTSETLPQVVITPNKGFTREGNGEKTDWLADRLTPAQIRNKSAHTGRLAAEESGKGNSGFWGADGFTFGDLIDVINPLQHIPVVSTVYRALTGDQIAAGPRMMGGALLGGVAGFALSAVSAAVESQTGKDIGGHALVAMGLADDGQAKLASAAQVPNKGVTLLSSQDPVTHLEEEMELAEAMKAPPTVEEAMQAAGIPLVREQTIGEERAIYALGGFDTATQRYQQVQSMNRLQSTALRMDVKG